VTWLFPLAPLKGGAGNAQHVGAIGFVGGVLGDNLAVTLDLIHAVIQRLPQFIALAREFAYFIHLPKDYFGFRRESFMLV
jgi:hypothetical protein